MTDHTTPEDRGREFRVSPDGRQAAIWEPGNEPWFIPESMQGTFVQDAAVENWQRFTPAGQSEDAGFWKKSAERAQEELENRLTDEIVQLRERADTEHREALRAIGTLEACRRERDEALALTGQLRDEIADWVVERDELLAQNGTSSEENSWLRSELARTIELRDKLRIERDELAAQKDAWWEHMAAERRAVTADRDALRAALDRANEAKEALARACNAQRDAKRALQARQDAAIAALLHQDETRVEPAPTRWGTQVTAESVARAAAWLDAQPDPTDEQVAAGLDAKPWMPLPDEEVCGARGPRIGADGTPSCVLGKGHSGEHLADESWGEHVGWPAEPSTYSDPAVQAAIRKTIAEGGQ